jgi:hypothetical protein
MTKFGIVLCQPPALQLIFILFPFEKPLNSLPVLRKLLVELLQL